MQMEILPEEVIYTQQPRRQSLKPQFLTEAEFNRPHSMAGEADLDRVMVSKDNMVTSSRPLTAQMIRPDDLQQRTSAVSPI